MELRESHSTMTNPNRSKPLWLSAGGLLVLFILLIAALKHIDVQPVGPQESEVGLATLNMAARNCFGVHPIWSLITDGLLAAACIVVCGFAALGLYQLIRGKNLRQVDANLYLLAGTYAASLVFYLLFELCVINYRPMLLDAELEASFPSSHVLMILCVMGTAIHQFSHRIHCPLWRRVAIGASVLMIIAAVIGRLLCGVHWLTDILGSLLLGGMLILVYAGLSKHIIRR